MYEINGNIYELRYNIKSMEKLEESVKTPIIDILRMVPSINLLRLMIASGLHSENGAVSQKRGMDLAEELIMEKGLQPIHTDVVNKIYEDCGFLFQESM